LAAAGARGKRVTLTLTNVPLQDALDIMLTMLDLEWTVRDDSVHISLSTKKPEPTVAPARPPSEKEATSSGATSGAKIASASAAGGKDATRIATGTGAAGFPLGGEATTSTREANAAQGGGVLRYRHGLLPVLQQEVGYLGGQELKRAEQKPELKAEPAYAGEPVYFLIDLGERGSPPHVAVYDPKGGGGEGAVYFDLDQDGDLAEEAPLLPAGWGSTDNFGPIAVKLNRDGFVGLYHFWMERRPSVPSTTPSSSPSPSSVAPSPPESWMLRPGCYNVGEITFAGKSYKAAMVDAWTNGRFDDICWSRLGQGDMLLVDWNGNGTFDWPEPLGADAHEYIMVGERYWREGTWYRPHFSTDGTEVSFTPTDWNWRRCSPATRSSGCRSPR
jgi:hypothetical protein